jgi:hypothetical protein
VPVPLGALVAFYTTMAWCSRRTATLIAVGACSVALAGMLLPVTDADPVDFAFAALLLGSTWAIGDSARSRRAYTAELEERAARLPLPADEVQPLRCTLPAHCAWRLGARSTLSLLDADFRYQITIFDIELAALCAPIRRAMAPTTSSSL